MELLDAGIDVYTTVNVQHLESLNDEVGQIAGIRIKETVPDTVVDQADEISLIDLPPKDLLDRLRDGKIYREDQAKKAAQHFFREGNLIALRELALRQTTQRVDAQMQVYREHHAIQEVWQVTERVLVCIGPCAIAERLVRAGKRFASSLRAEWIVVYVETPELERLPVVKRDSVLRVLKLATEMGAETITLSGTDMSEEILSFAEKRNVSKIMMGKPSRRGIRRWLMGSVVDTIIAKAHNINIYLLGSPKASDTSDFASVFGQPLLPGLSPSKTRIGLKTARRYGLSLVVTLISSLLAWGLFPHVAEVNIVIVYLLGVLWVALKLGRGPSVLASALGVLVFDYLFVEPYFSFSISDLQYLMTFVGILVVGFTTSHLTDRVKYQAKVASHRERRSTLLYHLSRDLASSASIDEALRSTIHYLHREFGGQSVFLFPDHHGQLALALTPNGDPVLHDADLAVGQWVFDHAEVAGKGTNTLPGANAVYFPMVSIGESTPCFGVLAIDPPNLRRVFLPEQRKLLDTLLTLVVQCVERHRLTEQARTSLLEIESERLRNSLLTSVSHDFRTPLATIMGASSTLSDPSLVLDSETIHDLSLSIHEEVGRMSRLVNNILDLARYSSGLVQPHPDWYPMADLVASVTDRLEGSLKGRALFTTIHPDPSGLVYLDAVMIEQVIYNLIENAHKYSPTQGRIFLNLERSPMTLTVTVRDEGPGIPEGEEERIFEKFQGLGTIHHLGGSGLGLAISKLIIDAHEGWISCRNLKPEGCEFTFGLSMPMAPVP
jgi:two-component system sensor histidine kinase KdpD